MFAKVIVDVPSKQTDRAFDYIIPAHLESWVEVGSRVGVPFGPRVIQGFVVETGNETHTEPHKLKKIDHVLDLTPPLTPELVQLARWMSRKYICHEITALQAMVPGALKAKYERHVALSGESGDYQLTLETDSSMQILSFIRQKESVEIEALLERFPSAGAFIKEMISQGLLTEVQKIKDRLSAKKSCSRFTAKRMTSR